MLLRKEEFYNWAYPDLNNNKTRADVAEFLVAKVLGLDRVQKRDWQSYDMITEKGLKIEVKASAYIQSWKQSKPSQIRFDIAPKVFWNEETGSYSQTKQRNADVYVFCLLKEMENINPLNTSQWEFYVCKTYLLDQVYGAQKSVGLKSLREITTSVEYQDLIGIVSR